MLVGILNVSMMVCVRCLRGENLKFVFGFLFLGIISLSVLGSWAIAEQLDSCATDAELERGVRCPACKVATFEFTIPVNATIPGPCTGTKQYPVPPPAQPVDGWVCEEGGCTVIFDANGNEVSRSPASCIFSIRCLSKQPTTPGTPASGVPDWLKAGFADFRASATAVLGTLCLCRPHCRIQTCEAAAAPDFKLTSFTTATSPDGQSCILTGTASATGKCMGVCSKTGVGG